VGSTSRKYGKKWAVVVNGQPVSMRFALDSTQNQLKQEAKLWL